MSPIRPGEKVAVLLGTRPEIIKLAPLIRELGTTAMIVHSRQHYDTSMSDCFFEEFGLPEPEVVLTGVGGSDRSTQIAAVLTQLTPILEQRRPRALIVQGDTNTVVAGALAASVVGIPVVHVEAGLRAHDREMPEEINRRVVGVLAELHCAPTGLSRDNLLAEGVPAKRVHVTGNTIVEACESMMARMPREAHPLVAGLHDYVLATIHRPENTDDAPALDRILSALTRCGAPVVLVAHPRTMAAIRRFGLEEHLRGLVTVDPVRHEVFLQLAAHSGLIVSDSGGIQEEVTVLKKPLVLVRRSTERPEAVDAGFVRRVAPGEDLLAALDEALHDTTWEDRIKVTPSPFGDGSASATIAFLARFPRPE